MSIRILHADDPLNDPQVAAVRDRLRAGGLTGAGGGEADVPAVVARIIADVEARGDAAVAQLTAEIENVDLTPDKFRVSADEIAAAHRNADSEFLSLVQRVIANIRAYQQGILVEAPPQLQRSGRRLSVRYTPIERVGIYVPGGRAMYPSTVLMTAVPAQVAGVGEIVMASPPTGGEVDPMVLAIAGELRIDEVYRVSGTAAIAAMAIGTPAIPPVQKIVGPGNAFIAEAKRQVMGRVGIDSIAGPSEVLIIADASANPKWLAADMLAQAEHDPGSAVLVTPSESLAERVAKEIELQIVSLDRLDAMRKSLESYSAIVVTKDLDAACELANDFAAEHLQIVTSDDENVLAKIRNAGAIFIGAYTPVPLGDYCAGPSHVLPTGGTAKFFGPLSCNDFRKASSVIRYDADALNADADDVAGFADREGLSAHAAAVNIRRDRGTQ